MKKIVFTGGSGRFAEVFKKVKHKYKILYPSKKQLNIENFDKIIKYLEKSNPDYLIHCAALSRPMKIHEENISKSILTNIIGTANIVRACSNKNIKLIYFSTNYVYPGVKGNYSENDPVLPINKYAISKLGGECAVQLYKKSLILRLCMTEKPFIHKIAFSNVITSFTYHENIAKILFKLINKKGIINIGGPTMSVYDFAKKDNRFVIKKRLKEKNKIGIPINSSLNINKLKKILK